MSTLLRKTGNNHAVIGVAGASNWKDGGKDFYTYTGSGSSAVLSEVNLRLAVSGRDAGVSDELDSGVERVASSSTGQLSIATASATGSTGVYLVRA